ncbi:acyltransferase [Cellvibrio sp. KY-GH-1]|nr:acyltransferase [Cellvibrio sp. KY-GH-1]
MFCYDRIPVFNSAHSKKVSSKYSRFNRVSFFSYCSAVFFVVCALIVIVFIESNWELHVAPKILLSEINKWILFNGELINAFPETRRIIAGVDWTLKYEWIFYSALPLLAFGGRCIGKLMALAVAVVVGVVTAQDLMIGVIKLKFTFCFFMGWMAAILIDQKWISGLVLMYRSGASLLALICLVCGCLVETYSFAQMLISGVAFILLASGANLFGLLELKASKILGDLSFGVYLLHGMLLYVAFTVFDAVDFSLIGYPFYWVIFVFMLIGVVGLSVAAHLLIERPFMLIGKRMRSIKNSLGS